MPRSMRREVEPEKEKNDPQKQEKKGLFVNKEHPLSLSLSHILFHSHTHSHRASHSFQSQNPPPLSIHY